MNRTCILLLLGIAFGGAGCTLTPKYRWPDAPVANDWPNGPAYSDARWSTNAMQPPNLKWREFVTDPKLQQVVGIALTNNRDLRLATLNVERARGLYGIQRGELLPAVHAAATGSKARTPADLSGTGHSLTSERYDANFGVASWEIDLFGRIRSLEQSAVNEFMATQQARRGAQILLVSSVTGAYLTLAADRENLALAATTLTAQQNSYNLIKRSHDLGLATDLDLYRAQTQVDAARGEIARFQQLAAQDENALTLLLGAPVPDGLLPADLNSVAPLREISPGVSSSVLLFRPDILQAEYQLKAAYANIGAARAVFFPRISLTAALGTASADLSGLFKAGSGAWSYAPQIVMPIFDARTWSAHKVAKVQRDIAVAQYEKAIQSAFRDVADALAVRGTVNEQVSAQQSLVNALAETYRLSQSRYEKGIDSYLSVLDAQRSLFAAQQGLVALRLGKVANDVRLYAVLGGGWQTDPPAPTLAATPADGN